MAEQEEIQLWQTVTPVEFEPKLPRTEAQALLISARQGAGYAIAAGQTAHAVKSRATHMLLDFSQTGCAIRYQIDGAWEQLPPMDRETGDAMLYALKQICQMNPADRRSAQSGKCGIKFVKDKFDLILQSQGVPTGERVLVRIDALKIPFERMSDLGMRDKMFEKLKERLDSESNIILITCPKGEGLTTTWTVALNAADRLVRDFQSFEDQGSPEPEIINISANFYGGDTGHTELSMLKKMILKEPDVLMFPELPEAETLELAIEQVEKIEKQIYTRMVAPGAIEGLVAFAAKYPGLRNRIADRIGAVLGQKLIRRLCDNCKVGFEPPPQLLQQLGIPAGRVGVLYQPFIPPPIEQQVDEQGRPAPITPCPVCNGRGYYGRIAIFELLVPGEKFKAALKKTQDVAQLTAIAKSEGHRGLQSEAVMTVARGLTGLDEVKRAFAKR
ncbi:putative type II secretion system protein E [Rubripirellula amarantea]|uniref:Putative type II secretion system protein E n=1 Tax=Rubripirellula amarantea TaxID=2527999 RepID=A0A5C5WUF5_9BACT|nr:ATPase, T2SS/T4P/T4SS family [Rubripirellula amarantea]TWT54180.1 putative type II secretion system protein E [Rubripirellula amarantea]